MGIFPSFSHGDAVFVAQLADALRGAILGQGETWARRIDRECARADELVVLVRSETTGNPGLESEWRAFLRDDWASSGFEVSVAHARAEPQQGQSGRGKWHETFLPGPARPGHGPAIYV